MFSTFTGNSRRPRNVNLSGSTGNPFANTAWSPSVVSNATKTVSNAQADREKRQTERNRLKAAAKIQRTWRGHRERRILREQQRSEFDKLYSPSSFVRPDRRRLFAPSLLLSFFSPRRNDDIQRIICYARDADTVELHEAVPLNTDGPLVRRLVETLIEGLGCAVSQRYAYNVREFGSWNQSNVPMQRDIVRIASHSKIHYSHSFIGSRNYPGFP